MSRLFFFFATALILLSFGVLPAAAGGNGTLVYSFADEPFDFTQCYSQTGLMPGPAASFGEDVCVHYVALNSETVRMRAEDIEWSLIQHGTATVTARDEQVLYAGPFQVEEIARDYEGDADCVWIDGKHAWIGNCKNLYGGMDFLNYNWKITGASVYYFNLSISGPGMWCFSSKQGGEFGTQCK